MSELINESNDENDVLIVANLSNDDILEVEPIYNALQDVKDTANLLVAFMKLYRRIAPKVKFEKAFADGNLHI